MSDDDTPQVEPSGSDRVKKSLLAVHMASSAFLWQRFQRGLMIATGILGILVVGCALNLVVHGSDIPVMQRVFFGVFLLALVVVIMRCIREYGKISAMGLPPYSARDSLDLQKSLTNAPSLKEASKIRGRILVFILQNVAIAGAAIIPLAIWAKRHGG